MAEMRARGVRVGVLVTFVVLITLVIYRQLPGHAPLPTAAFVPLTTAGAFGAVGVAVLPWRRLLEGRWGEVLFFIWSLLDIALISALVGISGAGDSPLWAIYLLTTVFFASSYPWRAQLVLLALTGAAYSVTVHVAGSGTSAASLFFRLLVLLTVWMLAAFLSRELQQSMAEHEAARAESAGRAEALLRSLEALEDAHVRLVQQERMAAVGETAATVAHELRNPLAVVNNVIYLVGERVGEDEQLRRHLDTALREIGTAARVVGDLLEFTRPRAPLPRETDLVAVLTEVIAADPPPPTVTLLTDVGDEPLPLSADPVHVAHTVRNLLSNAYDATAERPGGGHVRLTARADGHAARITVSDDGPGMSERASDSLFQPFATTKARGIGLGLVVASRLIRAQHGALTIDSDPGIGTTVTVVLPRYPEPVVPAQPDGDSRHPVA